jgi:chromosomal replication initiation ATPase DnaA
LADVVLPYFPAPVVIETVAIVFGIGVDVIRSANPERLPCCARHASILLLEEFTPLSQNEMAKALGRKDSTTARELLIAARRRLDKDPRFGKTVDQVRQRLAESVHV